MLDNKLPKLDVDLVLARARAVEVKAHLADLHPQVPQPVAEVAPPPPEPVEPVQHTSRHTTSAPSAPDRDKITLPGIAPSVVEHTPTRGESPAPAPLTNRERPLPATGPTPVAPTETRHEVERVDPPVHVPRLPDTVPAVVEHTAAKREAVVPRDPAETMKVRLPSAAPTAASTEPKQINVPVASPPEHVPSLPAFVPAPVEHQTQRANAPVDTPAEHVSKLPGQRPQAIEAHPAPLPAAAPSAPEPVRLPATAPQTAAPVEGGSHGFAPGEQHSAIDYSRIVWRNGPQTR